MRLSGCTIVRNGVKYGYPFIQSIKSILPICGEFVVGVGDSEDDTRGKIEAINDPKIRIVDTTWDMSARQGGTILSDQTNRVLPECKGRWIFYLQADEVVHEDDYVKIIPVLNELEGRPGIDGLSFHYLHFYASYYTVQTGRNWYAEEARIIRNNRGIVSHGDAQGFRKNGKKITAVDCGGSIYHYGWARPPAVMLDKITSFHQFWHDDAWIAQNCAGKEAKEFFSDLGNLEKFKGKHPAVMAALLNHDNDLFITMTKEEYMKRRSLQNRLRDFFRSLPLGRHRNFVPVKL